MTQQPQITLAQYALNTLDLSGSSLGRAMELAQEQAGDGGHGMTPELTLRIAEVQARVATATALMDIALSIREGNNRNAIFTGLEKVAGALGALTASQGPGAASKRF